MPLNLFYTMVQKSQKWPKTQIKGGGGSIRKVLDGKVRNFSPTKISSFTVHRTFVKLQYTEKEGRGRG